MQDYDYASRFRVDFVGLMLPKHYDALPNLEPLVQFKKREKHQWKSVITESNTLPWSFFSIFKLHKW